MKTVGTKITVTAYVGIEQCDTFDEACRELGEDVLLDAGNQVMKSRQVRRLQAEMRQAIANRELERR